MLSIEQIQCFVSVYTQGSYSAAARQLGKQRSTIRDVIIGLETDINTTLFVVSGKKVLPTKEAKLLFPRAQFFSKQANDLTQTAHQLHAQTLSEVTISHDSMISPTLISELHIKMITAYPYLKFNWVNLTRHESYRAITTGECQLAILATEDKTMTSSEVDFLYLGALPISAYAAPGSELVRQGAVSSNELRLAEQYMTKDTSTDGIGNFRISYSCHTIDNQQVLIEILKQRGWGLLSDDFASPYVDSGELAKIKIKETLNPYLKGVCLFFPLEHDKIEEMNELLNILKTTFSHYL
ncbi:LysR family transcriptional regulator [Vibrio sp. CAU 1672]|uniref:LysR family transcriptional regulator n=1 Tax=Vibrio sp. CAU 1672 TaxID=3032594 RepID=UPI0023DC2B1B|nr:LysR family transcriptional regulator [Vibrio sp. CAU 1672]MDF2155797.1 LysR family transcriptional regulator [Vibrio sp. CAU 1672]